MLSAKQCITMALEEKDKQVKIYYTEDKTKQAFVLWSILHDAKIETTLVLYTEDVRANAKHLSFFMNTCGVVESKLNKTSHCVEMDRAELNELCTLDIATSYSEWVVDQSKSIEEEKKKKRSKIGSFANDTMRPKSIIFILFWIFFSDVPNGLYNMFSGDVWQLASFVADAPFATEIIQFIQLLGDTPYADCVLEWIEKSPFVFNWSSLYFIIKIVRFFVFQKKNNQEDPSAKQEWGGLFSWFKARGFLISLTFTFVGFISSLFTSSTIWLHAVVMCAPCVFSIYLCAELSKFKYRLNLFITCVHALVMLFNLTFDYSIDLGNNVYVPDLNNYTRIINGFSCLRSMRAEKQGVVYVYNSTPVNGVCRHVHPFLKNPKGDPLKTQSIENKLYRYDQLKGAQYCGIHMCDQFNDALVAWPGDWHIQVYNPNGVKNISLGEYASHLTNALELLHQLGMPDTASILQFSVPNFLRRASNRTVS